MKILQLSLMLTLILITIFAYWRLVEHITCRHQWLVSSVDLLIKNTTSPPQSFATYSCGSKTKALYYQNKNRVKTINENIYLPLNGEMHE